MDFSKLPDGQRQQLEQLQQQFQEHQAQQQKQQEESAAAAAAAQQQPPPSTYDPSQVHQSYDPSQGYDQSSYYNYNYQDPSQQQQQQQQPAYYQADYSNTYQQPQQQQQQQQHYTQAATAAATATATVTATAYAPSVEQQRNDGSGSGSLGLGQVQDPYVDPNNQASSGATQGSSGYPAPPGLNSAAAAAVAALSQLTQFAGSMGAAERAMGGGYGPPAGYYGPGPGHYGPGYYDPGHYGPGPFRPPVGHSPYRGGGRRGGGPFRGGGRGNFGNRPQGFGGSGPPFHGRGRGRGRGRGGGRVPPASSAAVEPPKPSEGVESSPPVNVPPPTRIAWCELCRVDCTSKEILEQHKNGKRHKKNLQKGGYETQNAEKPVSDIASEAQEGQVGTDDTKSVAAEAKPWMKRKMGGGGGRGGKRPRPAAGPPKPKVVIPLMCDLCNVKCDTQEVFDRHIGGKKHVAKVKRFEGHQAMYGPTAVQALYPPNPLSQTLSHQQAYHGAPPQTQNPNPPPEPYAPPQTQNPNPQLADAPLEFGTQQAPVNTGNGVQ